jgi:hypothetical protein
MQGEYIAHALRNKDISGAIMITLAQ